MAEQKLEQGYKIRCSLFGHSMDVRAVAVSTTGDIVTASRDKTARLWSESSENSGVYEEKVVYEGHSGYVTSVCLIDGNEESPDGFTVTGSKDSTILIFPRNVSKPSHTLAGHSDTVSCLVCKDDFLVSGSWDHSIRIWKNWDCVAQLNAHSAPVWAVAIIEPTASNCLIISASADKTIKCWKDQKDVVTYKGHTDCVRGLSIIDNETFLSCSNDATVRLWNVSGACLATYYGHTSFIYSLSRMNPFTGFVSGGEDRSIRVWDPHGSNTHTIYLPAQSVWSVCVLPNSDIVAGTSDGVCRVFTLCPSRYGDAEVQSQFEESLSKFKVAVEDIGGINKSDLPDKTYLFTPGKRDGQTVMIRDGDKVMCYNWSASKGEWEAVGEVVGGSGGSAATSGKVLHEGREYDYVFDVDLDEGRVLKLPYNKGEDPWSVAQTFIYRHELPQDYLDQVANFIYKNANVSSQSIAQSEYYDPFTGGSRYVPSGTSGAGGGRGSDPFTGTGRYVPSSLQAESSSAVSPYFPHTVPLKFESVNKSGILTKLQDSNKTVPSPLPEDAIHRLVESVSGPVIVVSDLEPLEKTLYWPSEKVWPVLDVLRLALQSEEAQKQWLDGEKGNAVGGLLASFLGNPNPIPTQLLSLRCLANMASHEPGKRVLISVRDPVINSLISMSPYANKNLEIAVATLLINYAIIFKNIKDIDSLCKLLAETAIVAHAINDPEALFRILVGLGTILSVEKVKKSSASILDELKPLIKKLSLLQEPQKVSECARHILRVF